MDPGDNLRSFGPWDLKLRCFEASLLPSGLISKEGFWQEFIRQEGGASLIKITEKHYWISCLG